MTAMLMPSVNSYFAIYTLMDPGGNYPHSSANWDLHAMATDKGLAMSHAKMLALQPGVGEVHVKRVEENLASGLVSVRNIKSWKRGNKPFWTRTGLIAAATLTLLTIPFLF